MQPLEIAASVFTLVCVVLGVKRSLWQFPFGLVGTALFFFVFWNAQLYSSAVMQVFFMSVQGYGWWYWLYGAQGKRPPIRATNPVFVLALCAGALAIAALAAWALRAFTDAEMALPDAAIFGLSVVAQFLLDRKRIETWPVWIIINVLSVWVYANQGLWLPAGLYVVFFFNAFWGWWEWRQELRSYDRTGAPKPA